MRTDGSPPRTPILHRWRGAAGRSAAHAATDVIATRPKGVRALSTGIGEALRAARRQQGLSLGDVAASTKVRESHLAGLETEDFDALGGDVYVRGFITAYARYVGLDPEPLLEAHKQHRADQEPPPRGHWRRPALRGGVEHGGAEPPRVRVRSGRVAVLLALIVVVVIALVLAGLWGDGETAAHAAGWS